VHIPVIVLSYGPHGTFYSDKVFKSLNVIGKVLNKEKRAEEITNFIKNTLSDLKKRANTAAQTNKPTYSLMKADINFV